MHYRHDNVITLRTFSKVYGLAGLRIGYGFAREEAIGNLLKGGFPLNLVEGLGRRGGNRSAPRSGVSIERWSRTPRMRLLMEKSLTWV